MRYNSIGTVALIFLANISLSIVIGICLSFGNIRSEDITMFILVTFPLSVVSGFFTPLLIFLTKRINAVVNFAVAVLFGGLLSIIYSILFFIPAFPSIQVFNIPTWASWVPATMVSFGLGFILLRASDFRRNIIWITVFVIVLVVIISFFRIKQREYTRTFIDESNVGFDSKINNVYRTISLPDSLLSKQKSWSPESPLPLSFNMARHKADSILQISVSNPSLWHMHGITVRRLGKKAGIWGYSLHYDKISDKPIWVQPPDYMDIPVLFDGTTRGLDSVIRKPE